MIRLGTGLPADDIHFNDLDQAWEAVRAWIDDGNQNYLAITLPNENDLSVNRERRGAIVIHHNCTDAPGNFDACTTPGLSGKKINFRLDESNWAPIYRCMLLNKETLRAVLEAFVRRGELSDTVYWVRD